MSAVPIIGFVLVALLAIGFAAVPLWRIESKKTRILYLAAAALFVFAIGGASSSGFVLVSVSPNCSIRFDARWARCSAGIWFRIIVKGVIMKRTASV